MLLASMRILWSNALPESLMRAVRSFSGILAWKGFQNYVYIASSINRFLRWSIRFIKLQLASFL